LRGHLGMVVEDDRRGQRHVGASRRPGQHRPAAMLVTPAATAAPGAARAGTRNPPLRPGTAGARRSASYAQRRRRSAPALSHVGAHERSELRSLRRAVWCSRSRPTAGDTRRSPSFWPSAPHSMASAAGRCARPRNRPPSSAIRSISFLPQVGPVGESVRQLTHGKAGQLTSCSTASSQLMTSSSSTSTWSTDESGRVAGVGSLSAASLQLQKAQVYGQPATCSQSRVDLGTSSRH
jgi:hypothetical protein